MNKLNTLIVFINDNYNDFDSFNKTYLLDLKSLKVIYNPESNYFKILKVLSIYYNEKEINFLLNNYSNILESIYLQCYTIQLIEDSYFSIYFKIAFFKKLINAILNK